MPDEYKPAGRVVLKTLEAETVQAKVSASDEVVTKRLVADTVQHHDPLILEFLHEKHDVLVKTGLFAAMVAFPVGASLGAAIIHKLKAATDVSFDVSIAFLALIATVVTWVSVGMAIFLLIGAYYVKKHRREKGIKNAPQV